MLIAGFQLGDDQKPRAVRKGWHGEPCAAASLLKDCSLQALIHHSDP